MIQDLSDLAALGKAKPEPLIAISLDLGLPDRSETLSDEMAVLLARSNGKKMEDDKMRLLRDRAFVHMKNAVDEIRRCGQYVFWKDELRYKGYVSKFYKMKNQKAARNKRAIK